MQRRPALVASLATAFIFIIILLVAFYLGLSNQKTSEIKARTVAQQVSNALEIMAQIGCGHWMIWLDTGRLLRQMKSTGLMSGL